MPLHQNLLLSGAYYTTPKGAFVHRYLTPTSLTKQQYLTSSEWEQAGLCISLHFSLVWRCQHYYTGSEMYGKCTCTYWQWLVTKDWMWKHWDRLLKLHLFFLRHLRLFIICFLNEWMFHGKGNIWRCCYLYVIMQWFNWSEQPEIKLSCMWPMNWNEFGIPGSKVPLLSLQELYELISNILMSVYSVWSQ